MKLTEIAKGWFNFVQGSPDKKQMIEERLSTCDSCPNKIQLSETGQIIIQIINIKGSIFKCQTCNCPLAAKTSNPDSECPIGKWKQWVKAETYY